VSAVCWLRVRISMGPSVSRKRMCCRQLYISAATPNLQLVLYHSSMLADTLWSTPALDHTECASQGRGGDTGMGRSCITGLNVLVRAECASQGRGGDTGMGRSWLTCTPPGRTPRCAPAPARPGP
jgi:hypothetical protein